MDEIKRRAALQSEGALRNEALLYEDGSALQLALLELAQQAHTRGMVKTEVPATGSMVVIGERVAARLQPTDAHATERSPPARQSTPANAPPRSSTRERPRPELVLSACPIGHEVSVLRMGGTYTWCRITAHTVDGKLEVELPDPDSDEDARVDMSLSYIQRNPARKLVRPRREEHQSRDEPQRRASESARPSPGRTSPALANKRRRIDETAEAASSAEAACSAELACSSASASGSSSQGKQPEHACSTAASAAMGSSSAAAALPAMGSYSAAGTSTAASSIASYTKQRTSAGGDRAHSIVLDDDESGGSSEPTSREAKAEAKAKAKAEAEAEAKAEAEAEAKAKEKAKPSLML